ncbi:SPOR domain-containing protein [Lysobacter terrae]
MAAKRGKSQARRSGGNDSGIPGWAWLILGVLLTVVVIIVAPKYLKSDGDGFFRPQPNPDAQPAPVAEEEDAVAPEGDVPAPKAAAKGAGKGKQGEEYDFYTLLPGKEVPLSDAEIAATERAEAKREAERTKQAQAQAPADASDALPKPVDAGDTTAAPKPVATAPAAKPTTAPAKTSDKPATQIASAPTLDEDARYLLQAGAFQASGQAEELKAKIALLGLGARVEAAQINGATVYRVRMGPYGTASDLAEAKRKLTGGGLQALAIKVK